VNIFSLSMRGLVTDAPAVVTVTPEEPDDEDENDDD
jgi:hypothetical protein